MCQECELLLNEAEQIVLMAEAEHILILEEAKHGVNFQGARRPLFPHEVRSRVRFGDMNDALAHAERLNTGHISKAADKLVDELLSLVPAGATPAEAGAALAKVMLDPPETIRAILNGLETNVAEVLATLRVFGHDSVVQEANEQGIEFSGMAGDGYLGKALGQAKGAASAVVASLWSRVTGRATAAVVNEYQVARPAAKQAILKPGLKGTIDEARQLTHDQHNAGRKDGAAEVPEPPVRIYAGELLDGATCPSCYEIDGHVFESEEEAEQWYPNGGPMRFCKGGNRCRGTLIYDWSELGEDFDGGVDKETKPRLPFHDPNIPNTTGVPPRPDIPIVRPPVRDDMPEAGKKLYEDYYKLPTLPFGGDDLEVSHKGRFVYFPRRKGKNGKVKEPETAIRGGHGPAAKLPGKSRLPRNWTADDLRRAIESVIYAPGAVGFSGNTWLLYADINGILFHVRIGPDRETGKPSIFHAYPVSGAGVRKLLSDGQDLLKPGVVVEKNPAVTLYYNDKILEGET